MSATAIEHVGAAGAPPDSARTTSTSRATVVAGFASIGAGAIHAAAVGAHSEHRQAVVAFVAVAALQVGWGVWAIGRSSRAIALLGMFGNLGLVVAWVVAKTSGLPFVDGLEVAERAQFADVAAAALAALAAFAVLAHVLESRPADEGGRHAAGAERFAALLVAALAVPAMVATGGHVHADGASAGGHVHTDASAADASAGSATSDTTVGDIDAALTAQVQHNHGGATDAAGTASTTPAVVAKPYDPTLPIDLSGTPGVTPQQQAGAENLIALTLARLPQFSDTTKLDALGWHSIGDAGTGFEHFINWSLIDDDKVLDPDLPEALVYQVDRATGTKKLASAMFMLATGSTLDTVPDVGGKLMQWHIHDNLCMSGDPAHGEVAPKVIGITDSSGACRIGVKLTPVPMIHVWITPNKCGPFAALEGVGAGQLKPGEERLCDHQHGDGLGF